jgi:hypothetical protein
MMPDDLHNDIVPGADCGVFLLPDWKAEETTSNADRHVTQKGTLAAERQSSAGERNG